MSTDLKKNNINASEPVQHPKFPFVYCQNGKLFCKYHLGVTGMNKGAMKQHIEGMRHLLNFDTGEPIIVSGVPKEFLAHLKLKNQESKVETKQDNCDRLKKNFDFVFPDNPEHVRGLLVKYGFDPMIKVDIQNIIEEDKIEKLAEGLAQLIVDYMRQNPERSLEIFNSVRSRAIRGQT